MEYIVGSVLVLLVAMWSGSWLFKSIGISLGSGTSLAKAKKRLKQFGWIAVGALFIIGLIAKFVTPAIITGLQTAGAWTANAANGVADGTVTAANGFVAALPVIIGVILTAGYWVLVSIWSGKPAHRRDRELRQIGAGALFLLLLFGYLWLFVG
jgi:hypothetical protein